MSETEFSDTELIMISLVLTQNVDEYDDADSKQLIRDTATKARQLANGGPDQ